MGKGYINLIKIKNSEYTGTFNNDLSVIIDFTYGLIEVTNNYEKNTREEFFDKLKNKLGFIEED